jgi:hypothetical protein
MTFFLCQNGGTDTALGGSQNDCSHVCCMAWSGGK